MPDKIPPYTPPFTYEPMGQCISDATGGIIIQIRGWGRLIGRGHGGLGMSDEEAAKVQDNFGNRVAALLNAEFEETL